MIRRAHLLKDGRYLMAVADSITRAAYPGRKYESRRAYAMFQRAISSAEHCVFVRTRDDVPCGTIGALTLDYDVFRGGFLLIKILQADTPQGLSLLIKQVVGWASGRRRVKEVAFIRDFQVTERQSTVLHWAFANCGFTLVGGTYQLRR